MPGTFGIVPLIPGLANEVVLEIFRHFVAVDLNGPFTLVLVCSAWRDRVLRSKSLQWLRRDRRGRKPALMENREKAGKGICIVSFDGGGPGSLSQLRMLDEIMLRLAFKPGVKANELCPADYFDLMGGVGFGGLAALLLGRLRMTTEQAMEELATIGTAVFMTCDDMVTPEVNLGKLRNAIEDILERHQYPVDIKLHDSSDNQCKVVLFAAATAVMDHCHPFRTYPAPRKLIECTFVEAACATIATPEHFSPVAIGPRLRQQSFAGIPHGFDNPTREVVKEAQLVFGDMNPVSLVLSLGSGQRARLSSSDHHVTRLSRIHGDSVARDLCYQWGGIAEHLRLNVDYGMEDVKLDDWSTLGLIETHTDVYLTMNPITAYIDKACQWLLQRNGSATLGQLSGTNTDSVVKFDSESLKKYMAMEFKQMREVTLESRIEKITLVDPIGNDIPIPTAFCPTFSMLLDVIGVYFKHQKVPGSDYVERGDYRLVHGNRKIAMGPLKWARIRKVGLKVEMSMILRTRNQNSTRCPRCRVTFEGSAIDEWAQCLSCSAQFQIETHVEAEGPAQSDDTDQPKDTTQSGGNLVAESIVSPGVSEAESSKFRNTGHKVSSGETEQLQFRLISVLNFLEKQKQQNPDNQTDKSLRPITASPLVQMHGLESKIDGDDRQAYDFGRQDAAVNAFRSFGYAGSLYQEQDMNFQGIGMPSQNPLSIEPIYDDIYVPPTDMSKLMLQADLFKTSDLNLYPQNAVPLTIRYPELSQPEQQSAANKDLWAQHLMNNVTRLERLTGIAEAHQLPPLTLCQLHPHAQSQPPFSTRLQPQQFTMEQIHAILSQTQEMRVPDDIAQLYQQTASLHDDTAVSGLNSEEIDTLPSAIPAVSSLYGRDPAAIHRFAQNHPYTSPRFAPHASPRVGVGGVATGGLRSVRPSVPRIKREPLSIPAPTTTAYLAGLRRQIPVSELVSGVGGVATGSLRSVRPSVLRIKREPLEIPAPTTTAYLAGLRRRVPVSELASERTPVDPYLGIQQGQVSEGLAYPLSLAPGSANGGMANAMSGSASSSTSPLPPESPLRYPMLPNLAIPESYPHPGSASPNEAPQLYPQYGTGSNHGGSLRFYPETDTDLNTIRPTGFAYAQ